MITHTHEKRERCLKRGRGVEETHDACVRCFERKQAENETMKNIKRWTRDVVDEC